MLSTKGIFNGKINPFEDGEKFTKNCQLISFQNRETPLGFILTEFHAVIAFANHVEGICLLNEQVTMAKFLNHNLTNLTFLFFCKEKIVKSHRENYEYVDVPKLY